MALSMGFERHAIIGGCLDSFCLVCSSHLRCDDEVIKHIQKPVHNKNLDSAQVHEKYEEDKILKVNGGYFCIFCCILLPTIRMVALHISELQHHSNKGVQLLKRFGGFITAFDSILVTNAAWGGIIDDSCALCDVEVSDRNQHESDSLHVVNLIRNKVEFGQRQQIYRKVDNNSIYCVTCNDFFSDDVYKSHFNELEHNNRLEECRNAYQIFKLENKNNNTVETYEISNDIPVNEETNKDNRISNSSREDFNFYCSDEVDALCPDNNSSHRLDSATAAPAVLEYVDHFAKNEININFENDTAFCKKCFVHVDFNCHSINVHIEKHDQSYQKRDFGYVPYQCEADVTIKSRGKSRSNEYERSLLAIASQDNADESDEQSIIDRASNDIVDADGNKTVYNDNTASDVTDDPVTFANSNMLTYNKDNSNAYCRLCQVKLPAHISSMKEHVSGKVHKKNAPKPSSSSYTREHRSTIDDDEDKPYIQVVCTNNFIHEFCKVKDRLSNTEVIINCKFCLTEHSFHMITTTGQNLRCQACEVNVDPQFMQRHLDTESHVITMKLTFVIISLYGEFVREVRTGAYHCGYCNLISVSWDELQLHLQCREHRDAKTKADFKLFLHMQNINRVRFRVEDIRTIERLNRMGMGTGSNYFS